MRKFDINAPYSAKEVWMQKHRHQQHVRLAFAGLLAPMPLACLLTVLPRAVQHTITPPTLIFLVALLLISAIWLMARWGAVYWVTERTVAEEKWLQKELAEISQHPAGMRYLCAAQRKLLLSSEVSQLYRSLQKKISVDEAKTLLDRVKGETDAKV